MEHVPTPSQTVGPYLHIGMTDKHSVTRIAPVSAQGEPLHLKCRVFDADSAPINDAMIEIWQADAEGRYSTAADGQVGTDSSFRGFGRAATDGNGACEFETIRPGRVAGPGNTLQAPHLNVAVYARGILLQLYTRIYFAGDPSNGQDPVLALVPADRRATLMAKPNGVDAGTWTFEFRLRGEHETVFFDV